MTSPKKEKNERVTVNLDPESLEKLDELQSDLRTSRSEVVRRSLQYYDVVHRMQDLSPEELETILDLRLRPDNLLFDIGIFQAFLEEIGEPSEELKKQLREVGADFYEEYCAIGIAEPLECLKRLERTNLFRYIVDSDKVFTIIPMIRGMKEYLKIFFEGYMEASDLDAEVDVSRHKIRISVK